MSPVLVHFQIKAGYVRYSFGSLQSAAKCIDIEGLCKILHREKEINVLQTWNQVAYCFLFTRHAPIFDKPTCTMFSCKQETASTVGCMA